MSNDSNRINVPQAKQAMEQFKMQAAQNDRIEKGTYMQRKYTRSRLEIYTLQTGSFSAILRQNATAGVSLAVAFFLVLQKIFRFGALRSFEGKIFSHRKGQRTKKYWMYFKDDGLSVGKKIP